MESRLIQFRKNRISGKISNHRIYYRIFQAILFTLFCISVQNLTSQTQDPGISEKYESLISKKEKRILDFKEGLTENSGLPWIIRLFYRGVKDDYAVFYDWNGHEACFRYRKNKFDHDGIASIHALIPGHAYELNGVLTGMLVFRKISENKMSSVPEYIPEKKLKIEEKKDKNNVPVLKLEKFKSLETKELVY
ncbi:MAG: hypothetical protein K8R21_12125 [Leptospira sp.]|nr:hypothetical protein [Leptospira sp.]